MSKKFNELDEYEKIDTSKVGTYEVTYTALDGLKNKTVVTRKVEVISKIRNAVNLATEKKGYIGALLKHCKSLKGLFGCSYCGINLFFKGSVGA